MSTTQYIDNKNKTIYYIEQYQFHNDNAPAVRSFYDNDMTQIMKEYWYHKGRFHCANGPAIAIYTHDGACIHTDWFVNGIDITDHVIPWLKDNNISLPLDKSSQILFKMRFL